MSNGLPNNTVCCMMEDNTNNIWFGTGGGVTKYNGTTWTTYTTLNGLAHIQVLSMAIDSSSNYWFGTNGGGI